MARQRITLYIPKNLSFFNGPETVMFWINLFSFHCCRLWWHWSGYSFNVFRYCLYRFLFCMVIYFFGLLVILRRYTRLPNISSIINVLTCIVLLSLCIVILMWKPFFLIFIDYVCKFRNGSFYHDCFKFAEIFFLHICFHVYFFPDVFFLFEARRCLHVYNICLSWFLIMLPHGICSFSLCDVRPDIFAQFLSFYLEIYKYILYPMLSYRFIADIAIFSVVLQIICFLFSAKK